jgi:hypothetical protein
MQRYRPRVGDSGRTSEASTSSSGAVCSINRDVFATI